MRSFDEIKHLPQFPGIYGFKRPNNIQDNYSYIGLSNKLRESVSQHLLKRDSSVATGASAISSKLLNVIGGYMKVLVQENI